MSPGTDSVKLAIVLTTDRFGKLKPLLPHVILPASERKSYKMPALPLDGVLIVL
jgi:hypothetical protein